MVASIPDRIKQSLRSIEGLYHQLAGLMSCFFTLTEQNLDTPPICQYYGFRPPIETSVAAHSQTVDRLDTIAATNIFTIRSNFENQRATTLALSVYLLQARSVLE